MKLIRLNIHDGFRSLKPEFELCFLNKLDYEIAEEFNPYVFAGLNGSGKSNVLEALAAIFYHLQVTHLNFKPKYIDPLTWEESELFDSKKCFPNMFELEYLIPVGLGGSPAEYKNAHVLVTKEADKSPEIIWINCELFEWDNNQELDRRAIKNLLPEYVLAYSSGENEILSLPFFKSRFIQFDEYIDYLARDDFYTQTSESSLIYFDKQYSQALLLSLLLMGEAEVLKTLANDAGIEDIKEFRVIIKDVVKVNDVKNTEYSPILKEDDEKNDRIEIFDDGSIGIRITKKIDDFIEKLKACSTTHYYDYESRSHYFDYFVTKETKEAFRYNFENARVLFHAFQVLINLNLYTVSSELKKDLYVSESLYVSETIPILASDERIMRFKHFKLKKHNVPDFVLMKSLSDGEHQLIHALCICMLFNSGKSLFLLDEPETHFNPSWRARFISNLRGCEKVKSIPEVGLQNFYPEMLITTHSPFLISDSTQNHVLVFTKDDSGVAVKNPEYNTLGASINKITMNTFKKRDTIGGYAQTLLDDFRARLNCNGEDKGNLISEIDHLLGDSVEKVMLIKTIIDGMEEKP